VPPERYEVRTSKSAADIPLPSSNFKAAATTSAEPPSAATRSSGLR
jgi:hypothetical protein